MEEDAPLILLVNELRIPSMATTASVGMLRANTALYSERGLTCLIRKKSTIT